MAAADLTAPITKPEGLKQLVEILAREPIVAVDTESNSLYAYRERVCLIQFSTPRADYLVDPLALRDLSALARLFADPAIEKVFHAAEYDLICLRRDFGFNFAQLFDTMVASRILGKQDLGLGSILESEFEVKVDKRPQRANWGERPLSPALLTYARQDTHYLITLRGRLLDELQEAGLWQLASEDFQRLCQTGMHPASENHEPCWRVNGSHDLSPQQMAVMQELCMYRDQMARQIDRPLFKVMGDKTLVAVAEALPTKMEELPPLHGMTQHQIQRHGRNILHAVQRGLHAEPLHPKRRERPEEKYLARVEALRDWRKMKGREMKVESDIILPRDLLYELAERNPEDAAALAELMRDLPWRYEKFGGEILATMQARNDEMAHSSARQKAKAPLEAS